MIKKGIVIQAKQYSMGKISQNSENMGDETSDTFVYYTSGNPLQSSCLQNPMDRGVHGVSKDLATKQQQKLQDPQLVEPLDAEPWTQRTDVGLEYPKIWYMWGLLDHIPVGTRGDGWRGRHRHRHRQR